jgi:two-component system, chemotaxis family, sensor kinase Cph1
VTSHHVAHPPFGAADLTNCERELIHLAGSIQPQGFLLVLREPDLSIAQLSVNVERMLGVPHDVLLGCRVGVLGGDIEEQVRRLVRTNILSIPLPFRCRTRHGDEVRSFVGTAHRHASGGLIIELEPAGADTGMSGDDAALPRALAAAVEQIGGAPDEASLCDAVVSHVRALARYDRVMFYKFDPDGHGEIVAEAREAHLEPYLGLHYPASDIPQRARDLYIRNKVRVLVDVHYQPVPVVPRVSPVSGDELDMSLCYLRSMSPLHLQYLKNMGVTATLVASLVREGKLWGLIACHHYSPKNVGQDVRAACELLTEVIATRIAVVTGQAQAQAELRVRQLERQALQSIQALGDWRPALFQTPTTLLDPVGATGAVLCYEGETRTVGEVPAPADVRALIAWLAAHVPEPVFACSSLPKLAPEFEGMAPVASGLLAAELSRSEGEYLLWFRKERFSTVRWAGNPNKPVTIGDDPRELSPRRSFAVWSEQVRHTARAWTATDVNAGTSLRISLLDMSLQVRSLRVLIAEHHVSRARTGVATATDPVIIADGEGQVLLVNRAFDMALHRPHIPLRSLDDLPALFGEPARVQDMLFRLRAEGLPWRGELALRSGAGVTAPVLLRADPVPGPSDNLLGFILVLTDISERKEAEAVRFRVERAIFDAQPVIPIGGSAAVVAKDFDNLMSTILANASTAVMQITEAATDASIANLLRELEAATRRAADLTEQLLASTGRGRPPR